MYGGKEGVGFILLSQAMLRLMLRLTIGLDTRTRGLRDGENRVRGKDSLITSGRNLSSLEGIDWRREWVAGNLSATHDDIVVGDPCHAHDQTLTMQEQSLGTPERTRPRILEANLVSEHVSAREWRSLKIRALS